MSPIVAVSVCPTCGPPVTPGRPVAFSVVPWSRIKSDRVSFDHVAPSYKRLLSATLHPLIPPASSAFESVAANPSLPVTGALTTTK